MGRQIKGVTVGLSKKNLRELLIRACKTYGVSQEDVKGPSKRETLIRAREIFAHSAWERGASLRKIGVALGNRDRSVIISYLHKDDISDPRD